VKQSNQAACRDEGGVGEGGGRPVVDAGHGGEAWPVDGMCTGRRLWRALDVGATVDFPRGGHWVSRKPTRRPRAAGPWATAAAAAAVQTDWVVPAPVSVGATAGGRRRRFDRERSTSSTKANVRSRAQRHTRRGMRRAPHRFVGSRSAGSHTTGDGQPSVRCRPQSACRDFLAASFFSISREPERYSYCMCIISLQVLAVSMENCNNPTGSTPRRHETATKRLAGRANKRRADRQARRQAYNNIS